PVSPQRAQLLINDVVTATAPVRERAPVAAPPPPPPAGAWFAAPTDPRARLEQAVGAAAPEVLTALRLAAKLGVAVDGPIAALLTGAATSAATRYAGHVDVVVDSTALDPDGVRQALLRLGAAQDTSSDDEYEWWTGPDGERLKIAYRSAAVASTE